MRVRATNGASRSMTRRVGALFVATMLLAASACGDSDDAEEPGEAQGESGLTGTITIGAPNIKSGPAALIGEQLENGVRLAVDEINSSGFLGEATLEVELPDVGVDPARASEAVQDLVVAQSVPGIVSMMLSNQVLAVADVFESEQVPTIIVESAIPDVFDGREHLFGITYPQAEFLDVTIEHLAADGVEDLALVVDSTNPTMAGLGEQVLPGVIDEAGLTLTSTEAVTAQDQDFRAVLTSVLDDDPDALGLFFAGAQYVTAVRQVRELGFDGPIFAQIGASGIVEQAEEAADGVIFASPFCPSADSGTTADFVTAYEEEFGKVPSHFGAEAYDAVWMMARAIREAGSTDRPAIYEGLKEVAEAGFEGAMGEYSFEDQIARLPVSVIEIQDGAQTCAS